jgi:hypothetical protein
MSEHQLYDSMSEHQLYDSMSEHQLYDSMSEHQLYNSMSEHQLSDSMSEHLAMFQTKFSFTPTRFLPSDDVMSDVSFALHVLPVFREYHVSSVR